MQKGHYGHYSGNAKHSRVTNHNMDATKRDDEAHMEYLKEDVKYDNKHGHSDSSMTADEKHISKLAGDLKYDEKHHGSARHDGTDNNHNGDITESPSKFTQVVRRFKNDQTGPFSFARNLATTALAFAPLPFGKVKAVKNIASAFGNTSKQYLNLAKGKKPISGGGGTYGKPNSSNFTGSGTSRGNNINEIIGPLGKGLNKSNSRTTSIPNPIPNSTKAYNKLQYPMGKKAFSSKPVDFKGPNPAHKIGAGGNSYPR